MKKKPVKTVTAKTLNQTKAEEKTPSTTTTTGTAKTTETAKVQEAVKTAEEAAKKTEAKITEKVNEVASKATEKVVETTTDVKEAAKKTAAKVTAKKPVAKKVEKEPLVPEVYLQYAGREANQNDIITAITDKYVAEGHRASAIKTLQVYVKPEENAAYYVINQKVAGMVPLF